MLFIKSDKKIAWAKEIKCAKWLLEGYPEMDFWSNLDLGYKLNSLAFFLTDRGQAIIRQEYAKFKLANPQNIDYPLEKDKIIELEVKEFPKDILESIEGY